MKLLSTVTMCACAGMFAAHVSAQAGQAPATAAPQAPPPAAAAPQTPPPAATAMKADSVTIEGCVQRSPAAPTAAPSATPGATGTAGTTAASSSMFVLANAMKPAASVAPPAASGAPAAAASSAAIASSYRLDADDSKLTPHVGHKVEITGTVDSSSASSSPGASAVPKLKVDSVKMVAASCAP